MHQGMRRLRSALGMGLVWAVGWAIGGLLIGVTSLLIPGAFEGFFRVFDAPLTTFGTLSASGTLLLARKGETASLPPARG